MAQGFGQVDTYLGQELAQLDVGPIRACYLVPDLNRGRLIDAITAASRRWGGVTEPILPVGPDGLLGDWAEKIVAALKPDVFVDMGLDVQAREAASGQLGSTLTSWTDFEGRVPAVRWWWCHPLTIDWPLGDEPVPMPFEADVRELASVGVVEDSSSWRAYGPGIQERADNQRCACAQVSRNTVAWASAGAVTETPEGSAFPPPMPSVIWVSEPGSFADVVGFWNVRALVATSRSAVPMTAVLLPPEISDWSELADLLMPRFQQQYKRPRVDALIYSKTVSLEQLQDIAQKLGLNVADLPVAQEHAAPGSIGVNPNPASAPTVAVGFDPTPWCCYPRRYGASTTELVQVFSGRTVIRAAPPIRPRSIGPVGGWAKVSLSGLRPLDVPQRLAVARLFAGDAWFADGRLCRRRAVTDLPEMAVSVPEPHAVLSAALRDSGVTFELSDKGKYVNALLDRAPGLEELLSQFPALEVIQDLTRKRTDHFKQDLEVLLDGAPGNDDLVSGILALARERIPLPHQSVVELPKHDLPAAEIASVLEHLTALGLCSRGFSIQCIACQMESYVELSEVTGQAICPGCGTHGAYRGSANKPSGPVVRYRLSSLLDLASDQGAPPHILGLACLRREASGKPFHVVPGALLEKDGRRLGEVDLLGYLGEQVIVGEVKTSPAEFTEEQIKKDLSLAAQANADIYAMIAVHAITDEQMDTAAGMASAQGCRLLAFSGETARPGASLQSAVQCCPA